MRLSAEAAPRRRQRDPPRIAVPHGRPRIAAALLAVLAVSALFAAAAASDSALGNAVIAGGAEGPAGDSCPPRHTVRLTRTVTAVVTETAEPGTINRIAFALHRLRRAFSGEGDSSGKANDPSALPLSASFHEVADGEVPRALLKRSVEPEAEYSDDAGRAVEEVSTVPEEAGPVHLAGRWWTCTVTVGGSTTTTVTSTRTETRQDFVIEYATEETTSTASITVTVTTATGSATPGSSYLCYPASQITSAARFARLNSGARTTQPAANPPKRTTRRRTTRSRTTRRPGPALDPARPHRVVVLARLFRDANANGMYDPADAPLARRAVQLVRMRGRGAVLRAEGVTDADGLVRFDARAFPSGTFHVFDKLAVRSLGTFSYPTGAQVAQVNVLLAAHPAARASSSPRTTTRRRTTPQPKSNAWVKRAVFVNRALPLWSRRNLNASAASRPRIGYQAAGPWGPPRRINATWSLARVRKMERAWNVAVLSGVEGWNGRWEGRSGLLGGARAAAARVVQEAAPAAAKPWEAIGTRLEVGKLGAEAARRRLRARQTEECATIDDSLCAVAYDLCGTGEGAVAACFDPTAGPPDVPLTVTITTTVSVASTSTSTVVATPVTVTVCT